MWTLLAIVTGLVAVTWFVNHVNARHEAKRVESGPTADALVEQAWDEFTAHDEPSVMHERFDSLMQRLDVDAVAQKQSLVRLAVMAVRAEATDALVAIADRASVLDPGCGETRALDALAEAYAGPRDVAIRKLRVAGKGLAACTGCGAGVEGGLLVQEVGVALDALVSGEELARGA
jgi:hypothetical protein